MRNHAGSDGSQMADNSPESASLSCRLSSLSQQRSWSNRDPWRKECVHVFSINLNLAVNWTQQATLDALIEGNRTPSCPWSRFSCPKGFFSSKCWSSARNSTHPHPHVRYWPPPSWVVSPHWHQLKHLNTWVTDDDFTDTRSNLRVQTWLQSEPDWMRDFHLQHTSAQFSKSRTFKCLNTCREKAHLITQKTEMVEFHLFISNNFLIKRNMGSVLLRYKFKKS